MKQINSTFYPLGSDLIYFGYRKVCYGTILWNFHWLIHFALANNTTSVVRLFYIIHLFLQFEDHTPFFMYCCIQASLDFYHFSLA